MLLTITPSDEKLEPKRAFLIILLTLCSEIISGNFVDSQDASRRNTADVPGTKGIPNDAARIRVKASDNTVDDDQPLSTWFGGMQCPANVDDLSKLLHIRLCPFFQ